MQVPSQAAQGSRATGAQAAQRAAALRSCGPAPEAPTYYVIVEGTRMTVTDPQFGAGPSTAPPCPDSASCTFLQGAWRRVYCTADDTDTPRAPPAPRAAAPRTASPLALPAPRAAALAPRTAPLAPRAAPLAPPPRPSARPGVTARGPRPTYGLYAVIFGVCF